MSMLGRLAFSGGAVTVAAMAARLRMGDAGGAECAPYSGPKATKVRTENFPLANHSHGKSKVK